MFYGIQRGTGLGIGGLNGLHVFLGRQYIHLCRHPKRGTRLGRALDCFHNLYIFLNYVQTAFHLVIRGEHGLHRHNQTVLRFLIFEFSGLVVVVLAVGGNILLHCTVVHHRRAKIHGIVGGH